MKNIDIETVLKSNGVLKALVTDLQGSLKEIMFPSNAIGELTSVGVAYDGSSFHGINNINDSDAIILGDMDSLVEVPFDVAESDRPEYWIMCNILDTNGIPHSNCARSALINQQKSLGKLWNGGEMMVGAEPEAFFVERKEGIGSQDIGGNANYFNPRDPKSFLITEIFQALQKMGFEIERAHPEVGHEQFEINWRFDTAHRTADRIQIYKLASHKIARNHGFDVTFLPKPYPDRNGSGMHFHLSVQNKDGNLFYDSKKKAQKYFSDTALHFLSGILKYSRSIAAVANSTEASYARLVPGYEAPCVVAVGAHNRSAACRIPAIADQKLMEKAQRVEFRFPDPLANPYLLAHAFITAGMIGVQKKTPFKGFTDEDLFSMSLAQLKKRRFKMLPRNLWEAYGDFVMNPDFVNLFGKQIHEAYAELILKEVDECQAYANTESMRRHYFN